MSDQSGIYCITHVETGNLYVGSAVKFRRRFNEHRLDLRNKKHGNPRLQNIFNKYGLESLLFSILEVVEDQTKLREREQFWLDTLQPKLNIVSNSNGFSDKVRRKITASLAHKQRAPMSETTKEKLRIANTGRKISEETRQKLRDSHKGQVVSEETRAKQSAIHKGKSHAPTTEATKEKIRQSIKALWDDPDYVAKHHEALSEVMGSPEMRERLSKAHKGNKLSKAHKAKIGNAHRGMKRSEATKRNLSKARKLWWKERKRSK